MRKSIVAVCLAVSFVPCANASATSVGGSTAHVNAEGDVAGCDVRGFPPSDENDTIAATAQVTCGGNTGILGDATVCISMFTGAVWQYLGCNYGVYELDNSNPIYRIGIRAGCDGPALYRTEVSAAIRYKDDGSLDRATDSIMAVEECSLPCDRAGAQVPALACSRAQATAMESLRTHYAAQL